MESKNQSTIPSKQPTTIYTARKYQTNKKLYRWQFIQSTAILLSSVIFFIMVEAVSHPNENISSYLRRGLGMLLPMSLTLGVINYYFSKKTFSYFDALQQSLASIADGRFMTRLDVSKGGPLNVTYSNFNKMAAELEQTQILRTDFINNFSHEFKTPIASINGFAQLLLTNDITAEQQRQYLQIIATESSRLAALADNTILLSRLDSHQIMPNKRQYLLDEQLRSCAILLSNQWQKKNITLNCELECATIDSNYDIMQHVWLNILTNAIRFTHIGGQISISLAVVGINIIVKISDTGIGMSSIDILHIFEKYYQSDKAKTAEGLGLGMPIAKRIITLAGGDISVTSQPNIGTTFTITLTCSTN